MKTSQVIAEMLKENTGRHILDSGGAYGRHWEKNQIRDFDSEPESVIEFSIYADNELEVLITHNVYHWLNEKLEYESNWDKCFHNWAELDINKDKHWLELMEEFSDYVESLGYTISGIHGEGNPVTVNTYNGEDLLSQTLQYTYFNVEYDPDIDEQTGLTSGIELALLQIHGGCDVRGGYTAPRAFEVLEEYALFDSARAGIFCNECNANWYTDDGYHFYGDTMPDLKDFDGEETELSQAEMRDKKSIYNNHVDYWLKHQITLPGHDKPIVDKFSDKILIDEDGNGYCPVCGGMLSPSFY